MRHDPGELAVDKIRKCLVPDAGHPVGRHIDRHARPELEAEEDAVEEGERPAERVAHDGDGRYGLRREGAFDGREYALRGAAWGVCQRRSFIFAASCGSYEPGLFAGEAVVGFDRRWNPGEERWIERLEDETGICQVGEASAFLL